MSAQGTELAAAPAALSGSAVSHDTAMTGASRPAVVARIAALGDAAVAAHVRAWPSRTSAAGRDSVHIVFGAGGNATSVTRGGWSAPEDGYIWTAGTSSALALPLSAEAASHALQIELAPFVYAGRLGAQLLVIAVNGVAATPIAVSDHAVVTLDIPSEVTTARDALDVAFELPDAARPRDVSGVDDDRALGFSFRQLLLRPVGPASVVPNGNGTGSRDAAPAALAGPQQAAPKAVPHLLPGAPDMPASALMLRFESLGENCEFGLLQRRCGAEPLGLLRFASAPRDKLLRALRARFVGFGAPDKTVIELSKAGEYMVQDLAFGMNYHAWVKAGEQAPEDIHAREMKRVPFLVRKLIADMTEPEKIFVYHGMDPLTDEEASDLAAAIRTYGPGTLLWVELADDAHPVGTVIRVGEGLLKGFVDRFAPGENAHDFSVEAWVAVCRNALVVAA